MANIPKQENIKLIIIKPIKVDILDLQLLLARF